MKRFFSLLFAGFSLSVFLLASAQAEEGAAPRALPFSHAVLFKVLDQGAYFPFWKNHLSGKVSSFRLKEERRLDGLEQLQGVDGRALRTPFAAFNPNGSSALLVSFDWRPAGDPETGLQTDIPDGGLELWHHDLRKQTARRLHFTENYGYIFLGLAWLSNTQCAAVGYEIPADAPTDKDTMFVKIFDFEKMTETTYAGDKILRRAQLRKSKDPEGSNQAFSVEPFLLFHYGRALKSGK